MPAADADRVAAAVYAALGRPDQAEVPYNDVYAARVRAGTDILKAIAGSPQNGFHGSLSVLVTVANSAFLPAHDGEPGIPLIVPFSGAPARQGVRATADEISSWRNDTMGVYSRGTNGAIVVHSAADSNGMPSPVACRYSIVKGHFTFTGFSAQVPLIQLTRTMADTGVPDSYEPTLVKLIVPKLVKPGDAMSALAAEFQRAGERDLVEIAAGAMVVSPVPDVAAAQQMGVA